MEAPLVAYDLSPLLTGRWDLMTAQHWGVVAGIITYVVTVSVVLVLLVLGGTCSRLREQSTKFEKEGFSAFATPFERTVLYDDLLAAAASLPVKPADNSEPLRGKSVELRQYDPTLHLSDLFQISNGSAVHAYGPYDPDESIWRFFEAGPFESTNDLSLAPFMDNPQDGKRFVIIDNATQYVVGMASIVMNSPRDLRARLDHVWITPAFQRSHVNTDMSITILGYLFKQGYRRIEWLCDVQDSRSRKAAERVGFVFEGVLRKHRIVRGGNRDSCIFSITNSDWRDGLCARLEAKLRPASGISGPTRLPAVVGKKED